MSIREGRPFSVSYKALRGTAGGMTLGKAFTEGPDDSFDAGALWHHAALLRYKGIQYLIEGNAAPGLANMPHLYGLAEAAPVKIDENMSGVFIQGFTAKVAHMDPKNAYSESATDGAIATLNFNTEGFVAAYEASADDIARVKVNSFMTTGDDRGRNVDRLLGELVAMISDPEEKAFWKSLHTMEARNYMLHIFTLRETAPVRADHLRNFFPSLRMTYYKALKAGKGITLYLDDAATDTPSEAAALPKVLRADVTNALDPLVDRSKFPALQWTAVVRQHAEYGLVAELILNNEGAAPESSVRVWVHPSIKADGSLNLRRVKTPEVVDTEPAFWATAEPYIALSSEMNIVDEKAADEQRKKLGYLLPGSEIQSREDLRGIMTNWAYRLIGGAYWPEKSAKEDLGYGDQRNAHEPRCVAGVRGDGADTRQRKMNAVEALRIQSNKHNNRMDEANLIIRFLFAITFGTLVRNYSDYANGRNKNGRTVAWDLEEFKALMKATWLPKPAAPKKPAGGAAAGAKKKPAAAGGSAAAAGGSSANSIVSSGDDEASRSSGEDESGDKPKAEKKPVHIPPPETDVEILADDKEHKNIIVMRKDKEVASIPYIGQFHVTRNYLAEAHLKLGDDRFVEYVQKVAALNAIYFA